MTLAKPAKAGGAMALAVAMLCGCTGTTPPPQPTGSPGADPDVLVREALPTQPRDITVLAATGEAIWASFPGGFSSGGNRLSLDGGRSWQAGIGYSEIVQAVGYRGRFGYVGGEDGEGVPYVMNPTAPNDPDELSWRDEGGGMRAVGVGAALNDHNLLMTTGHMRRVRFPALPSRGADATHSYAFTGDAALVVRISATKGGHDYASLLEVATGRSRGVLRLPRTSQHRLAGAAVFSLVGESGGLNLCRQPLPAGAASCEQVAQGDRRGARTRLFQYGDVSVVDDPGSDAPLLIEGGRVTTIALPQGTVSWVGEGSGDPSRPLLRTVDARGEPHHLRVDEQGRTTEWITVPRVPASVASLALTPTTLLGTWVADARTGVWVRPLTGQGLGEATWLPGRAVDAASAARWLIWRDASRRAVYDNGVRVGSSDGEPTSFSGPYLVVDGSARRINGARQAATRVEAVFGSLVAEQRATQAKAYSVGIRDLADPSLKPVVVKLNDAPELYNRVMLWGDWVGSTVARDSPHGSRDVKYETVLVNHRTGRRLTRPGMLWQLGDGYGVLQVARENAEPDAFDSELAIWNTSTDELTRLGPGTSPLAFAAVGDRIAYTTQSELIVRAVRGAAAGQPRLLGVMASGRAVTASPWRADLDATKPLASGSLSISNGDGLVVRSLATPAAPAGSLRGLSWDGLDDAGLPLPKGTYRWTLIATAVDGTGQVVNVTGTGAAEGLIQKG